MVWFAPKLHKCNKCGYEKELGHNDVTLFTYVCPQCLKKFLEENIGEMIKVNDDGGVK